MSDFMEAVNYWVSNDGEQGVRGYVSYQKWLSMLKDCVDSEDFRPAKVAKEMYAYASTGYYAYLPLLVNSWCTLIVHSKINWVDDTILNISKIVWNANPHKLFGLGMSEKDVEFLNSFSLEEVYRISEVFFALYDILGRNKLLVEPFASVHRQLQDAFGFDWYILPSFED